MSKTTATALLLWVVIVAVTAAAATLLPVGSVRDPALGYNAWCSFAPTSTGMLLLLAGVVWVIRQYVRTRLK